MYNLRQEKPPYFLKAIASSISERKLILSIVLCLSDRESGVVNSESVEHDGLQERLA
jgi:hypothetical protein